MNIQKIKNCEIFQTNLKKKLKAQNVKNKKMKIS